MKKKENVCVVRKICIVGGHPCKDYCGQNILLVKVLWVEFSLGKVPEGKVPGYTSLVWGIQFYFAK